MRVQLEVTESGCLSADRQSSSYEWHDAITMWSEASDTLIKCVCPSDTGCKCFHDEC